MYNGQLRVYVGLVHNLTFEREMHARSWEPRYKSSNISAVVGKALLRSGIWVVVANSPISGREHEGDSTSTFSLSLNNCNPCIVA
jgi:hypothetical protein